MGFWGRLFGSDDSVSSVIDGAKKGLDYLVYTDQEESEDKARDVSEARKMVIEWLRNTQGQNLSRRLIALSITFIWLFLQLVSVAVNVASVWVDEPEQYTASAEIIRSASGDMVSAVMLILGFYFAAPHMGNIAKVALGRFGERNENKSVKN